MNPKWKEDFPIAWEKDHYITRRDLVKFLTLGSALLVGANGAIALFGHLRPERKEWPRLRIPYAGSLPPGSSLLFRYPTEEDPCILVRLMSGQWVAYSQICTHLSCAVVHRKKEQDLFCPCHHGVFEPEAGRPIAGPPTRPLPRIVLERQDEQIFAVGVEK